MEFHKKHNHHAMMLGDYKKRFFVSLFLILLILFLSPMARQFLGLKEIALEDSSYLLFFLSSVVYFYGGLPFLKGFVEEIKQRTLGMMSLVATAITTAYLYSGAVVFGLQGEPFFLELTTLIAIMLLGHWIEMKSVMGASRSLEMLIKLMPTVAHRFNNGNWEEVPVGSLEAGDKVLVKAGEKIPADGRVVEGETYVDESFLTGESKPVLKKQDDFVVGGSVNGNGSVIVLVGAVGENSYLSRILNLVKQAQESKSRARDFADKSAFALTIVALLTAILTAVFWLLAGTQSLSFVVERVVSVIVVACPHALGLAVPLVISVSTAIATTQGFLIRKRTAFENIRKINVMVFDKTGTLTEGKFGILKIVSFKNNVGEEDVLDLAGSVEVHSSHPIAQIITKSANKLKKVANFENLTGKGVVGFVGKSEIKVVSARFLREQKISFDESLEISGKTVVYVLKNNILIGAIILSDIPREGVKETITALKTMGIKTVMLTGDSEEVAKAVASEMGIDEYFARVLPQDKSKRIKDFQDKGFFVAMVGDGINDAPALAQANVSIAIGAGTDVAIETADIVLVKSNPLDVLKVFSLSKATNQKMVQNLVWATGYNIIAIPLATGIFYNQGILLTPAVGAIFMTLSTVIVAVNARFLKV